MKKSLGLGNVKGLIESVEFGFSCKICSELIGS